MFWMLVLIIVIALGYAASVLNEYTSYVNQIQPKMANLQKQADNLERIIESEASEVGQMEAELSDERELIENLHREIMEAQDELKRQGVREHELEMAAYKTEFKKSRKKV